MTAQRAMDRAAARLLRVQPQPRAHGTLTPTSASRPFETPLLVSALRCILRYLVLPLVLPLLGIASGVALGILLALDIIAIIAIVAALRRLWRIQHPHRWRYVPVALALAMLVGVFFVTDVRALIS